MLNFIRTLLLFILGLYPLLSFAAKDVTLDFQNIKTKAALYLLAKCSGLNIVLSDAVHGKLTLHLKNVSWQEALNVILKMQNLSQQSMGNVILIGSLEEMTSREKQALQINNELADVAPLVSHLFSLNYGKASDLAPLLKLSSRGSVGIDARTNALLVQDTPKKIAEVSSWIKQLDKPLQQVLIASRIVTIDRKFERDLGVKFGVTEAPEGLAFTKLADGISLDLELSALETEGRGQVISSPRVITANQQAAIIQSGQEIPYQERTSKGATTVAFKKAVLSLKVIPQITPHHQIILELVVNQDKRASKDQDVNGVPTINTRQLQTRVLVENGQTVVLGGIYDQAEDNTVSRVPFLGSIPLVGALFRNTQASNDRSELLIFVTPRIL